MTCETIRITRCTLCCVHSRSRYGASIQRCALCTRRRWPFEMAAHTQCNTQLHICARHTIINNNLLITIFHVDRNWKYVVPRHCIAAYMHLTLIAGNTLMFVNTTQLSHARTLARLPLRIIRCMHNLYETRRRVNVLFQCTSHGGHEMLGVGVFIFLVCFRF